jgi:hypothetical protein
MEPLVYDRLTMLVTPDPIAEIDAALADAATRLRAAHTRHDHMAALRLTAWINQRLDERATFTTT